MEIDRDKLDKRCPFCGGVAYFDNLRTNALSTIKCNDCYAIVRATTREKAIEKWNKRVGEGVVDCDHSFNCCYCKSRMLPCGEYRYKCESCDNEAILMEK